MVVQWLECRDAKPEDAGSIPGLRVRIVTVGCTVTIIMIIITTP